METLSRSSSDSVLSSSASGTPLHHTPIYHHHPQPQPQQHHIHHPHPSQHQLPHEGSSGPRYSISSSSKASYHSPSSSSVLQWTKDDDATLRIHLERGNGKVSWAELARTAFPTGKFTKTDCIERWKVISKAKPQRGPWTRDEDSKLESLVARHGSDKWVMIANEMGSRSGKQCRERWHNHLDPTINKGEWTAEEDELIHQLYAKMGSRWAEMAKHLPGRPDNAIKNYYNACMVREKRRRGESISSLAGIVDLHGLDSSPAPSMSRSTSTNSLSSPRYGPYVRSTPMSKSRSESISSLGTFSPLRGIPSEFASPAPYSSPHWSSSPVMARSQSNSSVYTPPNARMQNAAPGPLHIMPRDLNKDVFNPSLDGLALGSQPATPDQSPSYGRRQPNKVSPPVPFSGFPCTPPLSSESSAVWQPGMQQVMATNGHSGNMWRTSLPTSTEAFETLGLTYENTQQSFSHLNLGESYSFEPFDPSGAGFEASYETYTLPPDHLNGSSGAGTYTPSLSHSESFDGGLGYSIVAGSTGLEHSVSHDSPFQQPQTPYGSQSLRMMPFVHPKHQFSPETNNSSTSYPFAQQGLASVDEFGQLSPEQAQALQDSAYFEPNVMYVTNVGESYGEQEIFLDGESAATYPAAALDGNQTPAGYGGMDDPYTSTFSQYTNLSSPVLSQQSFGQGPGPISSTSVSQQHSTYASPRGEHFEELATDSSLSRPASAGRNHAALVNQSKNNLAAPISLGTSSQPNTPTLLRAFDSAPEMGTSIDSTVTEEHPAERNEAKLDNHLRSSIAVPQKELRLTPSTLDMQKSPPLLGSATLQNGQLSMSSSSLMAPTSGISARAEDSFTIASSSLTNASSGPVSSLSSDRGKKTRPSLTSSASQYPTTTTLHSNGFKARPSPTAMMMNRTHSYHCGVPVSPGFSSLTSPLFSSSFGPGGGRGGDGTSIFPGYSPSLSTFAGAAQVLKKHPTSDLMGVDEHGRACLPGQSSMAS